MTKAQTETPHKPLGVLTPLNQPQQAERQEQMLELQREQLGEAATQLAALEVALQEKMTQVLSSSASLAGVTAAGAVMVEDPVLKQLPRRVVMWNTA